jgi:dipeptidyl aminopeptidase/acylaminoacyl peptidase
LDISSKTDQVLDGIPMGVVSKLSWHPSGDSLGFNLSSARSVSDVYSYEISTQRLVRWTQGTAVGLDIDQFVEPELVEWKSFDGLMISGFLYSPKVDQFPGKRPVVVSIHGGPESQSRPIFLGRLNYYLNELGVAVLLPNVRGSAGYGKKFLLLDNGYLRENSYKDIGALLDWIKNRPQLDSNKIMITGGSYGGHMTLAVATLYSNQIACSVEVVGMSNLVTFLERTESYRQDLRRAEYGDERDPEMRAFLEKIAPINHVDQITKPLFIVQGQNDPRVPYTEAEQMLAAMQKQNTPVWYLMAKDEGHGFSKRKNQNFQFYSTVLFMKQYLLGND